jgi:hypothetical protein
MQSVTHRQHFEKDIVEIELQVIKMGAGGQVFRPIEDFI